MIYAEHPATIIRNLRVPTLRISTERRSPIIAAAICRRETMRVPPMIRAAMSAGILAVRLPD
jgi:hypothetical protein